MLSPICEIQEGVGPFQPMVGGVDVSPGATIGIRLADAVGTTSWYLEVIGTDELSTSPSLTGVNPLTHLVSTPTTVVTFTFPSGVGRSVGFKSTVLGVGGPIEVTFATYSLTASSSRVGFVTELREGDVDFGWATKLNPLIRSGGTGVDNFSYETVPTSTTVQIPFYQQMSVVGGITIDGTLDVVGELILLDS